MRAVDEVTLPPPSDSVSSLSPLAPTSVNWDAWRLRRREETLRETRRGVSLEYCLPFGDGRKRYRGRGRQSRTASNRKDGPFVLSQASVGQQASKELFPGSIDVLSGFTPSSHQGFLRGPASEGGRRANKPAMVEATRPYPPPPFRLLVLPDLLHIPRELPAPLQARHAKILVMEGIHVVRSRSRERRFAFCPRCHRQLALSELDPGEVGHPMDDVIVLLCRRVQVLQGLLRCLPEGGGNTRDGQS